MKKLGLLILVAATNVFAFQPKFEVEYVNYAWGYDNRGCLVDQEGNVFKYGYGHSSDGKGLVPAGKMSDADLKFADELTEKALLGKFTEHVVAADAGSTLWSARTRYGQEVKLQSKGDFEGTNSAPEAAELVKLLNGLCNIAPQE